jgi:hypothetical protein
VTCGFILAHPARKRRCQAASTREESQSRSDHGSRRANDGYALRPLAGRSSRAPHTLEIRRCGCASGCATALNHIHHTCDHQLRDSHHCHSHNVERPQGSNYPPFTHRLTDVISVESTSSSPRWFPCRRTSRPSQGASQTFTWAPVLGTDARQRRNPVYRRACPGDVGHAYRGGNIQGMTNLPQQDFDYV